MAVPPVNPRLDPASVKSRLCSRCGHEMDWHVASALDGSRSIEHRFVCDGCDLVDVFTMPAGEHGLKPVKEKGSRSGDPVTVG
jgi:hypothetical protein